MAPGKVRRCRWDPWASCEASREGAQWGAQKNRLRSQAACVQIHNLPLIGWPWGSLCAWVFLSIMIIYLAELLWGLKEFIYVKCLDRTCHIVLIIIIIILSHPISPHSIPILQLNWGKPHSNGARKAWTGSSHNLLYTPRQEEAYFTYPSRRRKIFLFAQQQPSQWEAAANQPVRYCHSLDLLFTSNEFSFKTAPFKFLLSTIKE